MIQLTRLNNSPLVVNCDLIKFIENTPDTVLTLVSGEKVVVLEPPELVIDKIIEFRRRVLSGGSCATAASGREFGENAAPPSADQYEG
jgi:flagellar protein FlbD